MRLFLFFNVRPAYCASHGLIQISAIPAFLAAVVALHLAADKTADTYEDCMGLLYAWVDTVATVNIQETRGTTHSGGLEVFEELELIGEAFTEYLKFFVKVAGGLGGKGGALVCYHIG